MLLRDLALKPWGELPGAWDYTLVPLGGGSSLGIFRATKTNSARPAGSWNVYYNRSEDLMRGGIAADGYRTDHTEMDEFEAQCVLDHYLQNKSPLKPSGDT
jgi:hypothetical protein